MENCSLGNFVSVLLITVGQTVSGLSGVLTWLGVTSFVLLCRFWYFMLKIILSFSSMISKARVVRRRHIFRELLSMGCHLEDYRARVGTWAARTSWATRITWRISEGN